MNSQGLLGALFDCSFTEFVTPRLIKLMFVISIVLSGFVGLTIFITGIQFGGLFAVLALIAGPVVFLLGAFGARIGLEYFIAMFRIADNTGKMAPAGESRIPNA